MEKYYKIVKVKNRTREAKDWETPLTKLLGFPHHLYFIEDDRYGYDTGDIIHTTNISIEKVRRIEKDYGTQKGYEWLVYVEGNGNQYKPCEIIGKAVATTNYNEDLLSIPESFVEEFIENKGKVENVLLEVDAELCQDVEKFLDLDLTYIVKQTEEGEVIPRIPKGLAYTKSDVVRHLISVARGLTGDQFKDADMIEGYLSDNF